MTPSLKELALAAVEPFPGRRCFVYCGDSCTCELRTKYKFEGQSPADIERYVTDSRKSKEPSP